MRGRNRPRKRNAQGKKAHCEQALEESSAAERRGPPSGPSVQQAFLSSCTRGPLGPANTASAQALIPVGNLSDWALCCRLVSLQPHSVTLNTASVCGVTVGRSSPSGAPCGQGLWPALLAAVAPAASAAPGPPQTLRRCLCDAWSRSAGAAGAT